jgi:hypothetical protein
MKKITAALLIALSSASASSVAEDGPLLDVAGTLLRDNAGWEFGLGYHGRIGNFTYSPQLALFIYNAPQTQYATHAQFNGPDVCWDRRANRSVDMSKCDNVKVDAAGKFEFGYAFDNWGSELGLGVRLGQKANSYLTFTQRLANNTFFKISGGVNYGSISITRRM